MKVAIATLLLLGISYVSCQQCHMIQVQNCLIEGVKHYQANGVPDDEQEVTGYCDVVKDMRDCLSGYSEKCMSPMQKELSSLLGGGASDTEAQLCTPGTELRNNYLKHAQCIAEVARSDTFKTIIKDLQVTVETTYEAQFKDRLNILCCGAERFHRDVEDYTREKCGEEAVNMCKIVSDMIFTELPTTFCKSFKTDSGTCNQLLPPSGTIPKGSQSKSEIAKLMDSLLSN